MNKDKEKLKRVYKMLRRQNELFLNLKKDKDGAYHERNMLVSALSKIYPSSLGKHDENDKDWGKEWLNIVYIQLPTGQASWHLHDLDLPLFAHLEYGSTKWDGHTTEEKYERLLSLNS